MPSSVEVAAQQKEEGKKHVDQRFRPVELSWEGKHANSSHEVRRSGGVEGKLQSSLEGKVRTNRESGIVGKAFDGKEQEKKKSDTVKRGK